MRYAPDRPFTSRSISTPDEDRPDSNVMQPSAETDNYRPVSLSRMTLTELMIPAYANFSGKIHGGILLSLMDKVAYACAARHSGQYCVTVSVDGVDFLQPVEVGELVSLMASVNYVGRSSMIIGIKVVSENFRPGPTHAGSRPGA